MADVAPFRALRYDQSKVSNLTNVVTPPYDVINAQQQAEYYASDPYNIIRVELNKKRQSDGPRENRYTRSAQHFANWQAQGVLKRDPAPAFYISETTYQDAEGQKRVRRGFFTLLKVEDVSERKVLPHEQTFTVHKEDRFQLTKAVQANISPIFALYPDDDNRVMGALDAAREPEPIEDFVDPMGLPQKLYRVTDGQACRRVQELMHDKVIFIADGHHRYETAINYRNYMRTQAPQAGPQASFNYTMTYLCSMNDPGLTIFACHRMLPHLDGFAAEDFLRLAKPYFDVQEISIQGRPDDVRSRLTQALAQADARGNSLGLVSHDSEVGYLLTVKPEAVKNLQNANLAAPLARLDVVILTSLVLEKLLGLDNAARDQEHTIEYVADMHYVLDKVRYGKARLAFLLNPTKVEQVQEIATAGLIMPRKATYFYPKVLTGLVINPLDPAEKVAGCPQ